MTQTEQHFIEELYRDTFSLLYHYAFSVLEEQTCAENLVNDTFLDAIRKVEILLTHESPGAWLMTALKLRIRHYKFMKARQPTVLPLDSVKNLPPRNEALSDAEMALSDEDREFYELYYKQGLSHKELSAHFAISVVASQKRLERIRQKLKSVLLE